MKKPTEENPYKLINQLARQNGFANYGEAMKSLAERRRKQMAIHLDSILDSVKNDLE